MAGFSKTMRYLFTLLAFSLHAAHSVNGLASTDTITSGGDNSRTGYQTNHNMDPAVVGSDQFGILWAKKLLGNYRGYTEQIFSQPLVYTPEDGTQYVYIATTMNIVYKINAKTGDIILSRTLHIPFLVSDLDGCVDINPLVGVTGTGVIDPDTDTWYLTSKTYLDQTDVQKGRLNGRYYIHAIDVNTLAEKPGFPISLEGTLGRNNPARMFQGGNAHQRPALIHESGFFYAGFASHCVQYNFTGWIIGWDGNGNIVESFVTEAGPEDPTTVKGGGVWMSGGGISSDNAGSLYFATGNGYASQLHGNPVPGRSPPSALEEAAVHMTIASDGKLTPIDFFMPWEKEALDGADKDLGTTPLELLQTDTFTCPNSKRLGVVTGKSGKTYFLNIDNLGGYTNGPNKLDAVPQVFQNENSVYAGAGVYPLEGGYIYINIIQYPIRVFKFSCDDGGNAVFTQVALSNEKSAFILGVGHGTTTSLNGQPGTGLLWVTDVQGFNLRVYNAVPQNGVLQLIKTANIPGTTKFTRPVFGDGRAYIATLQGLLYAVGSPVNLPLNCSSPYDFGDGFIGNSSNSSANPTLTISCKANINLQVTAISLASQDFKLSGLPTIPQSLTAGQNISFSARFTPTTPGPLSVDVYMNTTNGVSGYSTLTPISLKGNGRSTAPVLAVEPNTVTFSGVITGQQQGGVNQSFIIINEGDTSLNITSYNFSQVSEGGPTVTPNGTAGAPQIGPFTFTGLPSTIPADSSVTVNVNFNPSHSGGFAVYLTIQSNGGNKVVDIIGNSGTYPRALVEFQKSDGSGWVAYDNSTPFTFGNVFEKTTENLFMRLTNVGGNNSASLSVTVSKPPVGEMPVGAANGIDLAEGTILAPGQSANASLYCAVPYAQVNTDSYNASAQWTLNTGDPNFGKQFIQFTCNAVAEQVGPLYPNASAEYRYLGCYKENNPGRQLQTEIYANSSNENGLCTQACFNAGYTFAGSQYQNECWCGNSLPNQLTDEDNCNYVCAGNATQICGGNGFFHDGAYISLFADSKKYINGTSTTSTSSGPTGPVVNPGNGQFSSLGCYTEATSGRALSKLGVAEDNLTIAICFAACSGYLYAGAEYGRECYCGNTLGVGSKPAPATDCSMTCAGNATEYCGAGNRLNLYALNGTTPSNTTTTTSSSATSPTSTATAAGIVPTVGNFVFQGCYTEATSGRALTGLSYFNDSMTIELCAAQCTAFAWFGAEYGRECYCGNSPNAGSVLAPSQSDCNMLCPGNPLEFCGAGNRLQMYKALPSNSTSANTTSASTTVTPSTTSTSTTSAAATTGPTVVPGNANYTFIGCYTEATNMRALSQRTYSNDSMTVQSCLNFCSGYQYAGMEYARECYCGNVINPGSILAPLTDCKMTCMGDPTAYCGAGNRLQMYELTSALNSTSTASLTSTSSVVVSSSSTTSTTQSAASTTTTSASTSAPSNTTTSSAAASSSTTTTSASTSGPSNTTTSSAAASSSTTTTSASTSAPSNTTTSSAAASSSTAPQPWQYLGCANETNPRALSGASTSGSMTIEKCQSFCLNANYPLAGVEYGNECYCGNGLQNNSTVGFAGCNMACSANSSEICGGSSRLNVYNYTLFVPTIIVPSVGTYQFQSCYTEGSGKRALSAYSFANSTSMTAELCVGTCKTKGYSFAGAEYGKECYCGNSIDPSAAKAPLTDCNMVCSGNVKEYCGAGSRLVVYQNVSSSS